MRSTAAVQQITHPHRAGEVLIKFRPDVPEWQREQVIDTFAKRRRNLRGRARASARALKLTLRDNLNLSNAIFHLKQLTNVVEWAEPNYLVARSDASIQQLPEPDDPQFGAQWALFNTGQGGGTAGADIGAPAGWEKTTGSRDSIIAVIDTGIDPTHPDLVRNLWANRREVSGTSNDDDDRNEYVDDLAGWNFVADNSDVRDDHGHGTQMAGIIAAEGNNAAGITGVMWQASILPLKALDATGTGAISDVVEAIDYAVDQGASVINCSFGTPAYSQSLLDAINRAAFTGTLVVASAGNDAQDLTITPYYPASYNAGNLIAVAATTNNDQLAAFSNWGGQIAAPGVNVLTTQRGGGYVSLTGTSASAPLVSGVAGLLKTIRAWVSAQMVQQSLIAGVRSSPSLTGKVSSGGIVNLSGAIVAFENGANGGGNPGNGDPGNGGSPGGGSGGSGGGDQGSLPPLDYMRANTPNPAEPRVYVNSLPPPGYDDPGSGSGGGSANSYFTEITKEINAVGEAGDQPGEDSDPTAGSSQTGATSINLGSQNFNFTAPVLSLSGRAGLGVSLALNYNSKVWTPEPGGKIFFNAEKGYPAPGWRIGFGVIQGKNINNTSGPNGVVGPYQSTVTSKDSYIFIAPDGSRHELAKNATTGLYESYDSTYMDFNESTKVLRLMNGTRITFGTTYDYQFWPTEIKDRNGNQITIANAAIVNGDGVASNGDVAIDYVTDTLGRKIDFFYESNRLTRVRQLRNANSATPSAWVSYTKTHADWYNYVIIDYTAVTVATNFWSGLTADPGSSFVAYLPSGITYPTKHEYNFFYTNFGQIYLIEKYVPEVPGQGSRRRVAYTYYNLQSNGNASPVSFPGTSTPAVSTTTAAQNGCPTFTERREWAENWNNGNTASYWYEYPSSLDSKVTDPLGRIYYTLNGVTGLWESSRIYENSSSFPSGTPLKKVEVTYEKDSGPNYISNRRPIETLIEDASGNKRKTKITYLQVNGASVPQHVDDYQADGLTVYRRTTTSYTGYPTQHILALPQEITVWTGAGTTLLAKSTYTYDESAYYLNSSADGVIQHDTTNYGGSFIAGRGNLTTVTQYSVVSGSASSPRAIGHTTYDSQGTVRSVFDGANHANHFEVWDNYVNKPSGVGETHGMPTRVVDGDSYQSGSQYNWYNGLPTQSYHIQGTSPSGTHQNVVSYSYTTEDRPSVVTRPDGGTSSWTYWDNWVATAEYTVIEPGKQRYSFTAWDGAGNLRWQGGDHPDGVVGKYSIQKYVYDAVGRRTQVGNTIAINGSYVPQDGDSDVYTIIDYDKLDRQIMITRPDHNPGIGRPNQVTYSYVGCGCAGGTTTTMTDERGKKRKTVTDFLGRMVEAYDLTSAGATYSKAVYTYTPLDQMTKIEHFNNSTAHQDRTLGYDGYGRLTSETTPEGGTKAYTYTADDLVFTATDARSISVTFTYNNRHLLTDVNYSDTTPDVKYYYGEYGERTLMEEKNSGGTVIASTSYNYDTYKRLQTETRNFAGITGTFSVDYTYNYVGLSRVTTTVNGTTKNVNYGYNYAGALTGVGTNWTGTDPNSTSNVLTAMTYRGFGGINSLNYGNTRRLEIGYNLARQQMSSLVVKKQDGSDTIINQQYDYYLGGNGGNNGRIQKITDGVDSAYTTTYSYDDYNRLVGVTATAYTRSYQYDQWANLKVVSGTTGGTPIGYTLTFANNGSGAPSTNQISNTGYNYDAAGNMTSDGTQNFTYDAANRLKTASWGTSGYEYDGDGRRVKQGTSSGAIYYLWSSLLGEVVAEIDGGFGSVYRGYVYGPGGGQALALQSYDGAFYWVHTDHLGSGRKLTTSSGAVAYRGEFDPHGEPVYEWASGGATFLNSHKYTGYERDWITNLNYAKARTYQHTRGRFMQPDPLGLGAAELGSPQSLNLYSYVQNDPVNFSDPTGLLRRICYYSVREVGYWRDDSTYVIGDMLVLDYCIEVSDLGGAVPDPDTGSNGTLDGLQTGLDVLGLCPGLGEIADGANALISLVRGDYAGAGLSVGAMLPFLGWGATGGKFAKRAVSAGESGRYADLARRGVKGDNLTPHHMPQKAAGFTSEADGGALVIPHTEHLLTRTYGPAGRRVARAEAGLSFREVLARDVKDMRRIAGSKYNQGMLNLIDYYRNNYPCLMQK